MRTPEDAGLPTGQAPDSLPLVCPDSIARIEALEVPGQPPVLVEILDLFLDSARDRLPRLLEALDTGDLDAALAEAHGLKGSAGTVGAQSLAAACAAVERKARTGEIPASAPKVLEQLWKDTELALLRIQARTAQGDA